MKFKKTCLDNGLRILTSPMPHTRSVSVGFYIAVGSRFESDEEGGISHFIEHMLFKGTKKRPTTLDIAAAIEGVGGVFNGSTGREVTTYWAKVPQGYLSLALDVLIDILRHSKFEAAEIEKERRVIVEEINMITDIPQDWVHLLQGQLLWPNHPLGRDETGSKETVEGMTRESMLSYLERHYHPKNMVISVAGSLEHNQATKEIDRALSKWPSREKEAYLAFTDKQTDPHFALGYRETEQAHLALGLLGLKRLHPDRFALRLLSVILGEGMSSRLFLEVREKRGLAYSVHSFVEHLHDSGAVGVYAGVDPKQAEAALEVILAQLDRLRTEPVPNQELVKAKEFVKGHLLLQMEDSSAVASWLGRQEALQDRILTVDEVIEGLDAVTVKDIQRVAQDLLHSERLNLAVVGPFKDEKRFQGLLRLSNVL